MDYTITPAEPRSLVRRLAPWTAALGMFAGGGYGVYHFAAPSLSKSNAAPVAAIESASDRLLAAMPDRRVEAVSGYTTPFDAVDDRYAAAPALPPAAVADEVDTPRDAATVEPPINNPFASMSGSAVQQPVAGYRDQSEAAPTTIAPAAPQQPVAALTETTAPDADAAVPAPVAADEPPAPTPFDGAEVARGQEPQSINPLRAASRESTPPADADTDARAAFDDSAATQAPPALPPQFGGTAAYDAGSSPAPAVQSGRYPAPAATSTPPEPTLAVENSAATTNPMRGFAAATSTSTPVSSPAPTGPYDAAPMTATHAPAQLNVATAPPRPDLATTPADAMPYAATAAAITPTPGLATADGGGRPGERILEGLQSPTLTVQKLAPPEIQVGKKCTFAIRVHNNGQRTAHNVVITDEAPLGTQLIGTAPKANVSGSRIMWDLGSLSAGEERVVEMELLPTQEGELGSVASVTFAAQASAKTRCTRPQLALRLTSSPRVMIGERQLVQIEVSNPGTGDATGVMLLESVPAGVTHEAGPALEFEVGTLKPGETRRLELLLQADDAGLVDNVMTARADANLQVQSSCQFEIIAPALKVTVDGPTRRILERPATYVVSVDNPGTASAREVQLVTQLPKGLQFVSANNMGEYDASTHSVYWSLAELPANQRGTVELTALAIEPGNHTLEVATRAQQGLEDRTTTQVAVEGIVALSFEVQDVEDAIEVGGDTSYEVRVTNQGTKMATNVQVIAVLPPGLRAQAGQGDARFAIEGDRVVFAPLPQLAAKADASFRFQVQGLRAGDQRVTMQVTTDEVREPITQVESTQVYADE